MIGKAIVYFIISKLNNIYEQLPKQAMNEDYVQIRHFTIIDEATICWTSTIIRFAT